MKLLTATDDVTGEARHGAQIELPDGQSVYVPINQTNTPDSLKALEQRYLSGEISVKGCMSFADLIPRSLR
jgi:hypothetical protein